MDVEVKLDNYVNKKIIEIVTQKKHTVQKVHTHQRNPYF